MTLKVVDPINVTEAVLTASGIPEPDASVGEVLWQDKASKYKETTVTAPSQYRLNFEITRTNHGELIVVGVDRNTWALIKFDVNGNLVWSTEAGTDTGNLDSEMNFIGCSVSGDDLIMFWHNDNNQSANFDKVYRQVITGIAAQGSLPSYTSSANELVNFPSSIKQSENKRLIEQNDLIYAAHNNGTTSSGSVTVSSLYAIDGEVINSATDAFLGGGVESMSPALNGGFYVCTVGKILIRYSPQLVKENESTLNSVKRDFDRVAYYNGVITVGDMGVPDDHTMILTNLNLDLTLTSSYKKGDEVILADTHRRYRCLVSETFSNPKDTATGDAAAEWIDIGSTNKWKMFNGILQAKTTSTDQFTVTLEPVTYVNTLAALALAGVTSIRVEVDNTGGTTIYDKTFTSSDFSAIYDHYTYVFYQITSKEKLIVEDLPPLPNSTIRVTFNGTDMEVGELVHGFAINVGRLVAEDTKSDRFRFREQAFDDFGYPAGPKPITVELNTYDVLVPKLNNPAIQSLLDKTTGENTLWVGDIGGGQKLTTYGFFERSPIPFDMPNDINYQITVRASV